MMQVSKISTSWQQGNLTKIPTEIASHSDIVQITRTRSLERRLSYVWSVRVPSTTRQAGEPLQVEMVVEVKVMLGNLAFVICAGVSEA